MIYVCEFNNSKARYAFDPTTGEYLREWWPSEERGRESAKGVGLVRRVGLQHGRRVFVALFSESGLLKLFLDGKAYDLSNKERIVTRRNIVPFIKEFSVAYKKKIEWTSRYFFNDLKEDGYMVRDIFTYIAGTVCSPIEKCRFIYWWQGIFEGRDIFDKSFQDEVAARARLKLQ